MVTAGFLRRFAVEESGASMIETLVVLNILLLILIAFVEFSVAMNQWNLAAKATQVGARLAAVSDPVDSSLSEWSGVGPTGGAPPAATAPFPGDPVDLTQNNYDILCSGAASPPSCTLQTGATYTCTDQSGGSCGSPTYDADAMGRLVDGSDYDSANPTQRHCDASGLVIGMCDVLPSIDTANVNVRYQFTGLGYAGRPGGPVPTITVSLTGLTFNFLLLGRFLGLNNIPIPSVATTITGEDLSKSFP